MEANDPLIPAQAGIQGPRAQASELVALGPGFRGDERNTS